MVLYRNQTDHMIHPCRHIGDLMTFINIQYKRSNDLVLSCQISFEPTQTANSWETYMVLMDGMGIGYSNGNFH